MILQSSRRIIALLFISVLTMLATTLHIYAKSIKTPVKEEIFKELIDLKQPRYLLYIPNTNELWTIFSTTQGNLLAKSHNSNIVLNEGHHGHSSGAVYFLQNDLLHVVWREKAEGKELFLRTLNIKSNSLSVPILLDNTTEPLTRIKIEGTDKGKLFVVWYGEKGDSKGRRYSIYGVDSNDFGKTFSKAIDLTPQTISSIYPSLIVDEQGCAYMFTEVVTKEERSIIFRKNKGNGWEEPVSLGKVGTVSIFIRPIKVGNRLMVFWFHSLDGVPFTEMAYSDDDGKTWTRQVLEATKYLDLTGLQVVSGGDGQHVYLALSGVNVKAPSSTDGKVDNQAQENTKKLKDNVFIMYSHDGGKTFSPLVNLRHYPYSHTRAHLPNIVANGKKVVVVWNDYRNIRANLYMNYSTDGGITWQKDDIPLEEPGKNNTVLHWDINNLIALKDGKYVILAHRFKNDSMEEANPVLIEFKLSK